MQPLPCTAVVVDPSQRPVRQRPVLDRAQGTEAYSNHRGSHRAEADAEVRRRLPRVDARGQHPRVHQPDGWQRRAGLLGRSEEHTSELQSLMRISYAVFCLKTKNTQLAIAALRT